MSTSPVVPRRPADGRVRPIRRRRPRDLTRLALVLVGVLTLPACRISDLLERARSGADANQEPPPTDPTPTGPEQVEFDDEKDWIQLKTGEWLRGKLLRIRDDRVDFDSDKLKAQSFDLDDVTKVRSPRHVFLRTTDNRIFQGQLVIDGNDIWVAGERTVQLRRSELLSSLSVEADRRARVSGELSLGASIRSGNNDQSDYSASFDLLRETTRTRFSVTYLGAVSNVRDSEVTNNHRLDNTLDTFLTDRMFVTVPGLGLYSDRVQNIQLRVTPYAALGYDIVNTADQVLRFSLGPAYQVTRLLNVEGGTDRQTESWAANFATSYDWDITRDIEFNVTYNLTVPLPEYETYNHTFTTSLSVDLTKDLSLDLGFVWDRVNMPVADGDATAPLPNDFRSTIGIGWEF